MKDQGFYSNYTTIVYLFRFPPEVVGLVEETLSTLRPNGRVIPKSLEDAERQIEVLEAGFKEKVGTFLYYLFFDYNKE